MKTIIITGTKGFIGSNLKKELQSDYNIIEINEDVFVSTNWKDDVSKHFWTEIHCVFHVGACSNTLEKDVNYMMLVNYEFTKHLTLLCDTKKVPLIYSSSAANYGVNNEYPSNLYGWSKYVAEDFVTSKKGIALRYFNVYGPCEEHKGIMSSVAYQSFIKMKNQIDVFLFPNKPKRDFVYVKDIVSANIFAMDNYNVLKGKFYEVGSGNARTFEDVLSLMDIKFQYLTKQQIPNGYQFFTESNPKKWMPNWNPKWNLEKGMTDYKNYLNNNNI
jgi:ADP-L-glycero-D-manno-heptose 6-epimerase